MTRKHKFIDIKSDHWWKIDCIKCNNNLLNLTLNLRFKHTLYEYIIEVIATLYYAWSSKRYFIWRVRRDVPCTLSDNEYLIKNIIE